MADARTIVVTGASTGIGRACVARAVRGGAHVFAAVRKEADADRLAHEFGASVTPLIMDVCDEAAIAAGARRVSEHVQGGTLAGLVNNAGIAVAGPLELLEADELRRQFETNLFGLHAVTRAFLPLLGTDRGRRGAPGRIVMISSVGGKSGSPFVGPYAASKHALEGYAQSLRRELMLFGIKVVVVAPGAVATPIWDKADQATDFSRFDNTPYGPAGRAIANYMLELGRKGLPAAAIGDVVWRGLTTARPRQRYTILRGKFLNYDLPRLMPPDMVDNIIARRLGLSQRR